MSNSSVLRKSTINSESTETLLHRVLQILGGMRSPQHRTQAIKLIVMILISNRVKRKHVTEVKAVSAVLYTAGYVGK